MLLVGNSTWDSPSLFFSGANIFQIARNFSAIALIVNALRFQHLIQHSADPMNNSLNFSLSLFYYFPLLSAGKSTHTDRAAEMHTRRVGELKKLRKKDCWLGSIEGEYLLFIHFSSPLTSLTLYSFLFWLKNIADWIFPGRLAWRSFVGQRNPELK